VIQKGSEEQRKARTSEVRAFLWRKSGARWLSSVDEVDLEVQREGDSLVAHRSRLEAVLAYSGQNVVIDDRASRLHDLQVGGLTGLIHDHVDRDGLLNSNIDPGVGSFGADRDRINELGGDYTGGDAYGLCDIAMIRRASRSHSCWPSRESDLGLCRRICLSMKQNGR